MADVVVRSGRRSDDVGERPPFGAVIELAGELAAPVDRWIEEVYAAHHQDLYRYIHGFVRDPQLAEDVLQEAFLRLIRERSAGRSPDEPRAWLYRVATNVAISGIRRARTVRRSLPVLRDDGEGRSAEDIAIDSERDAELLVALATISPAYRAALVLAAQGFTSREIGTVLGRSDAAVRTLLCRSRFRLRERLTIPARSPAGG